MVLAMLEDLQESMINMKDKVVDLEQAEENRYAEENHHAAYQHMAAKGATPSGKPPQRKDKMLHQAGIQRKFHACSAQTLD